jgi:threonine dehydratase
MKAAVETPLVRLGNLFPDRQVFAKCEFVAPGGSFKWRGAVHLLNHLEKQGRRQQLVVPSMGNTALGAAVAAKEFGFSMVAVVPAAISRAKDEKLQALGVELIKLERGGSELLRHARRVALEREGYFVHPHLDPLWTDGYRGTIDEIRQSLPACRTLVFPVGGGGLLMGITESLLREPAPMRLIGCEAYNYPTYAAFHHPRSKTIAEGLVLDDPHPSVQERIHGLGITIEMVHDADIRDAMRDLYNQQALVVEPSSAVTLAYLRSHAREVEQPVCAILTGENITREDFFHFIAE